MPVTTPCCASSGHRAGRGLRAQRARRCVAPLPDVLPPVPDRERHGPRVVVGFCPMPRLPADPSTTSLSGANPAVLRWGPSRLTYTAYLENTDGLEVELVATDSAEPN
jgi:hypothetical protein